MRLSLLGGGDRAWGWGMTTVGFNSVQPAADMRDKATSWTPDQVRGDDGTVT